MKKELLSKGWSIIKCNNLAAIKSLSADFIKELKKNKISNSIFKNGNINNIKELRKFSNKLDDNSLNLVKKIYLNKFSHKILKAFSLALTSVFGKKVFLQKFPQIQIHRGFSSSRITFPHCEIMSAHSPYTYNIWVPFHEVIDNSGIFLIDDKLSVKLCDIEIKKKIKNRQKFLSKHFYFPKLKFGEALIFNAFVYHGAIYHNNKNARISLDARLQRSDRPLFEKYNEFFSEIHL